MVASRGGEVAAATPAPSIVLASKLSLRLWGEAAVCAGCTGVGATATEDAVGTCAKADPAAARRSCWTSAKINCTSLGLFGGVDADDANSRPGDGNAEADADNECDSECGVWQTDPSVLLWRSF